MVQSRFCVCARSTSSVSRGIIQDLDEPQSLGKAWNVLGFQECDYRSLGETFRIGWLFRVQSWLWTSDLDHSRSTCVRGSCAAALKVSTCRPRRSICWRFWCGAAPTPSPRFIRTLHRFGEGQPGNAQVRRAAMRVASLQMVANDDAQLGRLRWKPHGRPVQSRRPRYSADPLTQLKYASLPPSTGTTMNSGSSYE